jgi:hypothetical protein
LAPGWRDLTADRDLACRDLGLLCGKSPYHSGRINRLAFIGMNLDRAALTEGFKACLT